MAPHRHTPTQHLVLAWGRFRRLWLNLLRPGYVRDQLARRQGACRRCGACCQLGSRCRHLCYEGGLAVCAAYGQARPPNCRTFPIDEHDLADRDRIETRFPCGYSWLPAPESVRGVRGEGVVLANRRPSPGPTILAAGTPAMALAPAKSSPGAHGAGSNPSSAESAR